MQTRVADFVHDGRRIVAFLEDGGSPGHVSQPWPQVAERYAQEQGIGLGDARWYNVVPERFANGRPNITEFLPGKRSWNYEANLALARKIILQLGLDPDTLPLDL